MENSQRPLGGGQPERGKAAEGDNEESNPVLERI